MPQDELWQPIQVMSAGLWAFIEQSEEKGIFRLGASDLHIHDVSETFEFKLCHESDIQFRSGDQKLLDQVAQLWLAKGLTAYLAAGDGEWKRLE